ncbi:MAG: UDP-3-O-(3-hydroxymyristoyl)glucosamine N-acyltransferase [Kiritimatiellae bacterium]|nr:UDP-3-O-(3-hydroxymyristoyl)glucosamine N-acyltransferase [Kiritimatiellia bacterium]
MKASELAAILGGDIEGVDVDLFACGGLEEARPGDLSFCKDAKHAALVETTRASAVLLPRGWKVPPSRLRAGAPFAVIRVDDPDRACMTAAEKFAPPEPERAPGVHPSAVVDPSVKIGRGVHVGPFTVIEKNAVIGDGAVVDAQVFVGEGCRVGAGTRIYPQVTLREGTVVGRDCIIHCGVRLGGDGYGFNNGRRPDGSVFIEKIPQLGIVEIGDGVEIGSNTTIDRARIGRTYIGPMTKIDNLVQIGHNVKVKGYSGLIAQSGVAGSTEIGYGCLIWAQAGISGHIKIADGVQVGPQAGVPQSLDGSMKYVIGAPAMSMRDLAAITLAPKMIAKLKAEIKEIKARMAEGARKR